MHVGVVIGRFQVAELTDGHRFILNHAAKQSTRVIIFVGVAPIQGTRHDPLDYSTRHAMLRAEHPGAIILPLHDHQSDEQWSRNLDQAIKDIVPNVTEATLYGGRDSFQPHYHGRFTPQVVDSGVEYRNATFQRDSIGKTVRTSPDFRAGIIYAIQNRFPYTQACVDTAVVKDHGDNKAADIVLGRKPYEEKWRLPGGVVDRGETLEAAAARETLEEVGLVIDTPRFIGSFSSGDWRFKHAGEIGVVTSLFLERIAATRDGGTTLTPGDDFVEARWVTVYEAKDMVVRGHRPLVDRVVEVIDA